MRKKKKDISTVRWGDESVKNYREREKRLVIEGDTVEEM